MASVHGKPLLDAEEVQAQMLAFFPAIPPTRAHTVIAEGRRLLAEF